MPRWGEGLFRELRGRLYREHEVWATLKTVRRWYYGQCRPGRDNLVALAAVLGVDPDWLEHGDRH